MPRPPSSDDTLQDAAPYLHRVAGLLDSIVAELEFETRNLADDPAFEPLFDELRQMVSGGKFVRPTFAYWGWRAGRGKPEGSPALECAGAAIELIQTCALVHDDIMDSSPTRRGRPSAHIRFRHEAEEEGWPVDAAHFGESAALLLGDLALVVADRVFADGLEEAQGDQETAWHAAFEAFTAMRIEVTIGQYLDVVEGSRSGAVPETALAIASLKTARYTVERPLLVGAALAGRGRQVAEGLSDYGRHVGVAFQLRDDMLGAFGDPGVTGKPVGVDFREGKQTYLVAEALATCGKDESARLRSLLGDRDLDEAGIRSVQDLLRESGAPEICEAEIARRLEGGLAALAGVDIPSEAHAALRSLAQKMAYREA